MVIDFEQIQNDVSEVHQLLQSLNNKLDGSLIVRASTDKAIGISRTTSLLKPSKATLLGLIKGRCISFNKSTRGRWLYLMRSEVMEWLRNGWKLTTEKLTLQASQFIAAHINQRTNLTNRKGGRISHD